MNRLYALRPILRAVAIIIALVAAVDPAVTSNRTDKPVVSVVVADTPRDSALAERVARSLEKQFTVTRAPFAGADGSVIVGSRVPSNGDALARPVFAVLGERAGPTVTLDGVRAPAWAPAAARVPITATAHISGARGRTLEVTLRSGGLVVDRSTRTVAADDEHVPISLAFVPTAAGAAPLRVTATVAGTRNEANADLSIDVRDKRWAVLFFDQRPSWMSTFVRRAVERDARFVVTSRVVTSRNVSTDAGRPPGRLDDLAALELFDAVVVGAPEGLTDADVAGLDAFLRRRAGGVVLLFDRRVPGPYERLTDAGAWLTDSSGKALSIMPVGADSESMRATEFAWPARLPDGAEAVATPRDSSKPRPIVWRSAVGAGQLIVSGALDAWRFRDRSVSAFDRFWQTLIGEAANSAPPPVAVTLSSGVVAPGEPIGVSVTLRDDALSSVRPVRSAVSATLLRHPDASEASGGPALSHLWPDDAVGTFRGELRAPSVPGVYRLVVSGDGSRVETPIVVAASVARPTPEFPERLGAWVVSRGGRVLPALQDKELAASLVSAIQPAASAVTWYPMRNAWWIVPFALLLSGEWWSRRRRGLV